MTLIWTGTAAVHATLAAALDALESGADELLRKSNETIPLDTSAMMHSGQVDVFPDQFTATVSYNTPYAVRQHEDLTYRHAAGRRARWLELTAREDGERLGLWIGKRMRATFGRTI
jgi:hypothetical protein